MRLHGFCTECRRVKLVSVSGHVLARAQAGFGVVQGICPQCEERKRKERKR